MKNHNDFNKLSFPISKGILFIKWEDISYFESKGNYCYLIDTQCEKFLIHKSLLSIEKELSRLPFLRVHKSCLVNASNIREYKKTEFGHILMDCGKYIAIGKSKKDSVINFITDLTKKDFSNNSN